MCCVVLFFWQHHSIKFKYSRCYFEQVSSKVNLTCFGVFGNSGISTRIQIKAVWVWTVFGCTAWDCSGWPWQVSGGQEVNKKKWHLTVYLEGGILTNISICLNHKYFPYFGNAVWFETPFDAAHTVLHFATQVLVLVALKPTYEKHFFNSSSCTWSLWMWTICWFSCCGVSELLWTTCVTSHFVIKNIPFQTHQPPAIRDLLQQSFFTASALFPSWLLWHAAPLKAYTDSSHLLEFFLAVIFLWQKLISTIQYILSGSTYLSTSRIPTPIHCVRLISCRYVIQCVGKMYGDVISGFCIWHMKKRRALWEEFKSISVSCWWRHSACVQHLTPERFENF